MAQAAYALMFPGSRRALPQVADRRSVQINQLVKAIEFYKSTFDKWSNWPLAFVAKDQFNL
jgi:hypothetical protein